MNMNTKHIENELYKLRSVRACIKSATDMMISNPLTILRRTWLPTLVLSIVSGISILLPSLFESQQPTTTEITTVSTPLMILSAILLVAYIAVASWWGASVISLLTGRKVKDNIRRMLYLLLAMIGLYVILGICVSVGYMLPMFGNKTSLGHPTIVSPLVAGFILVLALIFILPIGYSAMKIVEYTGEEMPVTVYVNVGEFLSPGTYHAYIFAEGTMIGSGSLTMAK